MKVGIGATALAGLLLSSTAYAQDKIKVGVTATLEGTYTVLGVDGIGGFNAAVKHYGPKAGGKELEFVIASTDATPDSAVRAVRKLIEQDKVQILISPLSGDEGIAVKNFSKTHPELTFVNAASGAQETTFPDPSPNFFRWNMDGAQWQAGLGDYAYNKQGLSQDRDRRRGLFLRLHAGHGPRARILRPRRAGDEPPVGAARHQGLRLDDRGAARRRRRDLSRPRRRRRRQLPQPVPAGGRQGASARRLDHGRPDRALRQGRREESDDRHDRRQRHGRHLGQSGLEGVREALSRRNSGGKAFPEPGPAGDQLLRLHVGDVRGAEQGQRRPERQSVEVQGRDGAPVRSTRRTARSASTRTVRRSGPTSSRKSSTTARAIWSASVVKIVPDVHQTLGYPRDVFAKIGPPSRTNPECKKY